MPVLRWVVDTSRVRALVGAPAAILDTFGVVVLNTSKRIRQAQGHSSGIKSLMPDSALDSIFYFYFGLFVVAAHLIALATMIANRTE